MPTYSHYRKLGLQTKGLAASVLKGSFEIHQGLFLVFAACMLWPVLAAEPERSEKSDSKAISLIQTLSPYCYQPDDEADICYISFQRHQVSSTVSMRNLKVTVRSKRALENLGFFQSILTINQFSATKPGIQVPCGGPGAGSSDLLMGSFYSYQISATDSDTQTTSNFGSIGCPAYFSIELFQNGFEGS